MNAVSPFSLFDKLSPKNLSPAGVIGAVASGIAESAKGKEGLAGAFSDAWTGLDVNGDGALNSKDVLHHAAGARDAVLHGIADLFGYESNEPASAARDVASNLGTTVSHAVGSAGDMVRSSASAAQMLLAAAPPALPSAPAARAVENLPGIEEIRATYSTLRSWN